MSVFVIFFRSSRVEMKLNSIVINGVSTYVHQLMSARLPKSISPNTKSMNTIPNGIPSITPIKLII